MNLFEELNVEGSTSEAVCEINKAYDELVELDNITHAHISEQINEFLIAFSDVDEIERVDFVLNFIDEFNDKNLLLYFVRTTEDSSILSAFTYGVLDTQLFLNLLANPNFSSENINIMIGVFEENNPNFFEEIADFSSNHYAIELINLCRNPNFENEHYSRLIAMAISNNLEITLLTLLGEGQFNFDLTVNLLSEILERFTNTAVRVKVLNSIEREIVASAMDIIFFIDGNYDFAFYLLNYLNTTVGSNINLNGRFSSFFISSYLDLFDHNQDRQYELACLLVEAFPDAEEILNYIYRSRDIEKDENLLNLFTYSIAGMEILGASYFEDWDYQKLLNYLLSNDIPSLSKYAILGLVPSAVTGLLLVEYPFLNAHIFQQQPERAIGFINYEDDPLFPFILENLPASFLIECGVSEDEIRSAQRYIARFLIQNDLDPTIDNIQQASNEVSQYRERYGSMNIFTGRNVVQFNSDGRVISHSQFIGEDFHSGIEQQNPLSYHLENLIGIEDPNADSSLEIQEQLKVYIRETLIAQEPPMTCMLNGHGAPYGIDVATGITFSRFDILNVIIERSRLYGPETANDIYLMPTCFNMNMVASLLDDIDYEGLQPPIFLTLGEFNQVSYTEWSRYRFEFFRNLFQLDRSVTISDFIDADLSNLPSFSDPTVTVPRQSESGGPSVIQISSNKIGDETNIPT